MRSAVACLVGVGMLFALSLGASAQQDLVETVKNGCKKEIDSFCGQVTPGQGRILACLYAHGDKLSGRCEFALYDAAVQLERAVAALTYVANECDADIEKHCANVEIGEGRILECLKKNKISKRCDQALADTGLK